MLRKWLFVISLTCLAIAAFTQGNYCWQWRKTIEGGIPGSIRLISVYNGFIYTAGEFADVQISTDNGAYANKGGTDIVIVKRDTKGNIIWLRTIGGPSDDIIKSICTDDQGSIYVAGTFSGSLSAGTNVESGKGGTDVFIAKYTAKGNAEWIKVIGSAGNENIYSIIHDAHLVRFAGTFSGTLTIGNITLSDNSGSSFSGALYDADGSALYAHNYHKPEAQYQRMDRKGNIYLAGTSSTTLTIGNTTIRPSCKIFPLYGDYTPFFWGAKLDSTGQLLWAKDFLPCDPAQPLEYYREYPDFYVDESGYIYLSFIDGRWPTQYGPSPGDPYNNVVAVLSSDGNFLESGNITTYGFLGTVVIRRYFLHATNKKVLLKNTTQNQIEYLPTIPLQGRNENIILSNFSSFNSGFIDTGNNAFFFPEHFRLSKLGVGIDVNAGPDRMLCASYQLPVVLGDSPIVMCGIPPYSYQWTPSIGLSNDTVARPVVQLQQIGQEQEYYLTVTGPGFIKRDTVKIIKNANPGKPIITASNNILFATSTVSAAYHWYHYDSLLSEAKGNVLPLKDDGAYRVKVTDTNFCSTFSDTFYAYRITINAGNDTAICNGKTVQLGATPTGATATGSLTYEWSPSLYLNDPRSANPVAAPYNDISYKLIITNSYGNNASDSVRVKVLAVPSPVITQQGDVLHSGYTSGNQWFFNGQPIANAQHEDLAFVDDGQYTVQVTDTNGCTALSPVYYAAHRPFNITIYPSPVTTELNIQYDLQKAGTVTIEIFNLSTGIRKIILNNQFQEAGRYLKNIKNPGMSKGIYLVRITTQHGVMTRKFIVQLK